MEKLYRELRIFLHKIMFINIYIKKNVILYGVPKYVKAKNIDFGENVRINDDVFLHASEKIIIGNNTTLSYGSSIITESYDVDDFNKYLKRKHKPSSIKIGNNVWIGAKSIILPGVKIANNVIVGAGSVVTKNLDEENAIYAGVPAKKIKKIGD